MISGSEDSFVSSDEESGTDSPPMASRRDVRAAYFSSPGMPDDEPDQEGRRFLRGQATSYLQVPSGDNTLPMPQPRTVCYDTQDTFGVMQYSDHETVGHVFDKSGSAVGRIVEKLPPAPNANYTHTNRGMQYKFERAMGANPDERRRVEVKGLTNPSDPINGDAQLSATRVAEVTANSERSTYFNRQHTQEFTQQDTGRDMYDGYNLRAPNESRAGGLEHTWRNALPAPQAPTLPESSVGGAAAHGVHTVRRKEVAPHAFRRTTEHGHRIAEQATTAASAGRVVPSCFSHRGENASSQPLMGGSTLVSARRSVLHTSEREEKQPEKKGRAGLASAHSVSPETRVAIRPLNDMREMDIPIANPVVHCAHGRALHGKVSRVGGDDTVMSDTTRPTSHVVARRVEVLLSREGGDDTMMSDTTRPTSHVVGRRVEALLNREGGDDARLECTNSPMTPHVESVMSRTTLGERKGGEDKEAQRAADEGGAAPVAARVTLPHAQPRDMRQDVAPLQDPTSTTSHTFAPVVHARHSASGTDVTLMGTTNARTDVSTQGQWVAGKVDTMDTQRAEYDGMEHKPRSGNAHVECAKILRLVEDRIPTCEEATWSFGSTQVGVSHGLSYSGLRDKDASQRSNASLRTGVGCEGGGGNVLRSKQLINATRGEVFVPDRLSQPHDVVGTQIDRRVDARVTSNSNRCTPVSAMYGVDVPIHDIASIGKVRGPKGRETPINLAPPRDAVML
jgi:hypothetical protein